MKKPEGINYYVVHDTRHDKTTIKRATYGEWLRRSRSRMPSLCKLSAASSENRYFVLDSIQKPPVVCITKAKAHETLESFEIMF